MTRSTSDHSIFYHHTSSGQCIYLIVYVDEIVITCSDQYGIQKLKKHIFRNLKSISSATFRQKTWGNSSTF